MEYKMRAILIKADSIEQLNSKLKYTIGQYANYNEIVNFCDKIYMKDNYDEIREELSSVYFAYFERYLDIYINVFQETADEAIPERFRTIKECIDILQKVENENSIKVNGTYYFYQKNANKLDEVKKMIEDYKTLLEMEDSPIIKKAEKEYDEKTSSINDPEIVEYFRSFIPSSLKRSFQCKKTEFKNIVPKIADKDKRQIINNSNYVYKRDMHRRRQK